MPYLVAMSGLIYLAGAVVLGIGYLYYSIEMLRRPEDKSLPMKSFGYSINYLMILFVVLLIDHYIPIFLT